MAALSLHNGILNGWRAPSLRWVNQRKFKQSKHELNSVLNMKFVNWAAPRLIINQLEVMRVSVHEIKKQIMHNNCNRMFRVFQLSFSVVEMANNLVAGVRTRTCMEMI